MKRRALRSRKLARNVVVLAGIVEVVAVAFAVMTVRSLDLRWTMKLVRSLPAILSPVFSFLIYTAVVRLTKLLDHKDQKTLERLRAERKAKIDELKERTNYYTTQQLIQRYDLDPAAKAAAASVLASKLGTDSGLNVFLRDESNANLSLARSNDVELVQSSGLRNRRHTHSPNDGNGSSGSSRSMIEVPNEYGASAQIVAAQSQMVVEHHRGPSPSDGGWIGRIAALLVGEDPSNCYALICGNCLRHNGLAKQEDFPHIMYYCPHCHALNSSQQQQTVELESGTHSGMSTPSALADGSLVRTLSHASSTSGGEASPRITTAVHDQFAGAA
ncbi:uncharacterized protein A4U43_C04F4730 [Asparagus officinalis]|uniref:Lunapark zinc ribbon domain-containing protein n=2 Tax=Asparagus officinalis TaxID=4686 RepID=A0A5P1F394_ASPOF|nr:uncharacterized protein A4U43_C04F4730 [Asparagus officinalis]